MNLLTERQAYTAMFSFLEHRYRLSGSDELGALLGDMSLLPDGCPADPAIWNDWLESVRHAQAADAATRMELFR